MTRLRVLFITPWYPTRELPAWGIFVRELARAVHLYDDVVVVHLREREQRGGGLWKLEEELDPTLTDGILTYRLWYSRIPIPKGSFVGRMWATLAALRKLGESGFRPDIIHAHVYASATAALPSAKLCRIPLVVTEHSSDFPLRRLRRWDTLVTRLTYGAAAVVMPVSRALQQSIESYGIRARFHVVPNAVDLEQFRPPRRSHRGHRVVRRLLFVGLLDAGHKKGVPYLLRALSALSRSRTDWQLDIVGDGPARSEYERLAAHLGIGALVTFHGLQPKSRVAEFMREADLFVLPSPYENMPCVLIEAMASGLPILSTRVGGIPELVDDSVGYLVPPRDVSALSEAADALLDRLDTFDRGAIAARAQQYGRTRVGQLIDALYRDSLRS